MSYDLACTACGTRNPLGRLYCKSCGTKLEVTEQTLANARDTSKAPAWTVWLRGLRVALTLALLAALILVLRPVAAGGQLGQRTDANEMGRKLTLLQDAVMESRDTRQRLEERELNAYLFEVLKRSPVSSSGLLKLDLRAINARLLEGQLVVVLDTTVGPLRITQEIRARPVRQEDRWRYDVLAMRVGLLPLPRFLGAWMAGRSAGAFDGLVREREVLDRLQVLEVKSGWVLAATSGP